MPNPWLFSACQILSGNKCAEWKMELGGSKTKAAESNPKQISYLTLL